MSDTGRPPYTLDDLPDNWQEKVLAMYTDGASDIEIRTILQTKNQADSGIVMSFDLWKSFMETHEVFANTIKAGRALAEQWHMKASRQGMFMGSKFNATVFGKVMANRFGWSNALSVTNNHNGEPITGIDVQIKFVEPGPRKDVP